MELLAELIMGGNIGTRKEHEPVLEFRVGLGVGTVTIPAIGTASGSALGAFGGGLTRAATFC